MSRNLRNPNREVKMRLLRQSDVCALCGKKFTNMKEITIDHIIPLSKGGQDGPLNMQLAHEKCNMEKSNKYDETNNQ
jgi:5-methylcytosine-specific restriction endonuclease McrA